MNTPSFPRDRYGKPCLVTLVRIFGHGHALGAGFDPTSAYPSWFVYDRHEANAPWHMHCGPFSTKRDAESWIMQIRATHNEQYRPASRKRV